MAPRSQNDFSLWPERARPGRRRFSASRLAGAVSAGVVCLVAGYAVVSEMTRPTALQEPIGRSWEDFSGRDHTGAVGAGTTGAGTVGSAPVRIVPDPVVAPRSANADRSGTDKKSAEPRPRNRSVSATALTPIGTPGPSSPTDGRSVPDGRPPVDLGSAPVSPQAQVPAPVTPATVAPATVAPATVPAGPAADTTAVAERKPGEPPAEAIVAADDDKRVAERPKRKKVARKKTRSPVGVAVAPQPFQAAPQQWGWGGNPAYRRAEVYVRPNYGPQRPGGFFPY